jgi:hypothetical protein
MRIVPFAQPPRIVLKAWLQSHIVMVRQPW